MTPNLLDAVEAWAAEHKWWFYRSEQPCMVSGRHFLNMSVTGHPPFFTGAEKRYDFATLFEDGVLSHAGEEMKIIEIRMTPEHPDFFLMLETELRKLKYD